MTRYSIPTARTLDELLAQLRDDTASRYDWTDLPTYGGAEPADTTGVWSWDATRLLVGEGRDGLRIVDRAALERAAR